MTICAKMNLFLCKSSPAPATFRLQESPLLGIRARKRSGRKIVRVWRMKLHAGWAISSWSPSNARSYSLEFLVKGFFNSISRFCICIYTSFVQTAKTTFASRHTAICQHGLDQRLDKTPDNTRALRHSHINNHSKTLSTYHLFPRLKQSTSEL